MKFKIFQQEILLTVFISLAQMSPVGGDGECPVGVDWQPAVYGQRQVGEDCPIVTILVRRVHHRQGHVIRIICKMKR